MHIHSPYISIHYLPMVGSEERSTKIKKQSSSVFLCVQINRRVSFVRTAKSGILNILLVARCWSEWIGRITFWRATSTRWRKSPGPRRGPWRFRWWWSRVESSTWFRTWNFDSNPCSVCVLSGIQIRRNLFGIKSRFFEHMKSWDYKFKSLGKSKNISYFCSSCRLFSRKISDMRRLGTVWRVGICSIPCSVSKALQTEVPNRAEKSKSNAICIKNLLVPSLRGFFFSSRAACSYGAEANDTSAASESFQPPPTLQNRTEASSISARTLHDSEVIRMETPAKRVRLEGSLRGGQQAADGEAGALSLLHSRTRRQDCQK